MGWKIGELFHGIRKKNEPAVRPEVIIRLQQIRDLYLESADIMANTRNLTTFLYRYEDARRFISGFNSIMVQEGQVPIPEMNDDIDAGFFRQGGLCQPPFTAQARDFRFAFGASGFHVDPAFLFVLPTYYDILAVMSIGKIPRFFRGIILLPGPVGLQWVLEERKRRREVRSP